MGAGGTTCGCCKGPGVEPGIDLPAPGAKSPRQAEPAGGAPDMPAAAPGRRRAIAAESVDDNEVRNYKKPVYPKDNATKDRIKKVIKDDNKLQVLLGHLGPDAIEDIVNAFRDYTGKAGEDLIKQGDEGNCLYIINEGSVDVFVARPGPDGKVAAGTKGPKVVSLGPGALFGELALMYSAPRAATATVASAQCKLWQLDREPFKMLLAQKSQMNHDTYQEWLAEVEILKSLNKFELSRLSEMMSSDCYDGGDEIIKQGESGDTFYILEDGTCEASIAGAEGEKVVKTYSTKGDYFGEIALLREEPRKATVRATGEGCSVISVSKEDFTAVLGPIEDILRNSLDKYPQYAQFLK